MFAPMMTPMDCASVINPAFTKLTTITVVALDDWMSAVIRIPVRTPIMRFLVIAARILRRRSPANFSRPSDIVFIPKRNNASEPTSEKMLIINSIFYNFAAKILQSYYAVVTLMLQSCYKRYSANAIEKVKIGHGNECPLKIEIHMRAEVGFFQVEEVLIPKIQSSPAKSLLELYAGVEGEEMKRYM
jgi:hypothetical protein